MRRARAIDRAVTSWLVLGLLGLAAAAFAQQEPLAPAAQPELAAPALPAPEAAPVAPVAPEAAPVAPAAPQEAPAVIDPLAAPAAEPAPALAPEAAAPVQEPAPAPDHGVAAPDPAHGAAEAAHGAAGQAADTGHGEAAGAHGGHGATEESPLAVEHGSWFYPLAHAINQAIDPSGETQFISGYTFVTFFVVALLVWLAATATAGIRAGSDDALLAPRGLQNLFEMLVEGLSGFFGSIIGPHGKPYTPLVLTFFLFILLNNWIALIPGFVAPTSSLNLTIAVAFIAFCAIQYFAIQANGFKNYLLHFAGQPKDTLGWVMAILMFPLEVVGELVKPLSLSLRLCGNIFGEDTVVLQIMGLWLSVAGWKIAHHTLEQSGGWWATLLPMHLPMQMFSIFGGLIQALVFSMLVSVYISLLTSHHDEEHDHKEAAHH